MEEFEKRFRNAMNCFMFSLEMLEKEYDMNPGRQDRVLQRSVETAEFEDELERNNYIEAVATAYRVSRDSLEKMVAKMAVSAGMAETGRKTESVQMAEKKKRKTESFFTESIVDLDDRGGGSV